MIEVKGSEPKVLVTTRYGREQCVSEEIMNALYELWPEVIAAPYTNRGIVVIYLSSDVDPYRVVRILKVKRISRAFWAIPIDRWCKTSYEDIVRTCWELILLSPYPKPIKFVGVCRRRGFNIDSCSRLLRYVGMAIENSVIGEVSFHDYDYVLRIEILGNTSFLSLIPRERLKDLRLTLS